MRAPLIPVLLTSAILAAGCGGGPDEDVPQGEAINQNVQKDSTSPKGKGKGTVVMENIEFEPKNITVKAGRTVKWVNQESIEHNVVAESVPGLSSQLFGKDGKYEYKTTQAGTIAYECTVHPGMEGTVTVE